MSSTTIYACTSCSKTFNSLMALTGHKRMHGESQGKVTYPNNVCCIFTKKIVATKKLDEYHESILGTTCGVHQCQCGKFISDKIKYCSRSCSTTATNKLRPPKSDEIKRKISQSLKQPPKPHTPKIKTKKEQIKVKYEAPSEIVGAYSKVYKCKCSHCGILTILRIQKKYCQLCSPIYGAEPRNRYKFTFNVYKYPDLFDLDMLSVVGFYAPRGKSGKWNPNGLSRDHKVSVNESLRNNYDPYYITHPINCELMPHVENNKKKSKSSITYENLVQMVDAYENSLLAKLGSNQ